MLSVLTDFVKPNPYFVYYMFKDTIHVDDYGSIKETLFKFPALNKVTFLFVKKALDAQQLWVDFPLWRRCELQGFNLLRHKRRRVVLEKIARLLNPQILLVLGIHRTFTHGNTYHWRRLTTQERN